MIAPADLFISPDDQARLAHHTAYLLSLWAIDPQRAAILGELLEATYKYASIAAGDILLALDHDLHRTIIVTA